MPKLSMPKKVKGTYDKAKYQQKVQRKTKTIRASTTAATQSPKSMKPSNFWKVPKPDDPIYMQYLSILNGTMYEDVIDLPQSREKMVNTPFKKKLNYSFLSKIKQGTIKEYKLHMYFITQSSNFSKYEDQSNTLPVIVKFGDLMNTLIPFNERCEEIPKNMSRVESHSIESDQEFNCYLDKDKNNIYVKDNQYYSRIGDWLTLECVYSCFQQSRWGDCNNVVVFLASCIWYEKMKRSAERKRSSQYKRSRGSNHSPLRVCSEK